MKILSCLVLFCIVTVLNSTSIELFLKADSLSTPDQSEEKEDCLQKLIMENPENGSYYFSLGYIYFDKKEYRKSISKFKIAQELGWKYDSSFLLAKNYALLDKPDSALFYLKDYIISPFKGPPIDIGLADSVFTGLHDFPEFKALLPPDLVKDETINWINEVDYLSHMVKITHYDPFWKMSEEEWDRYIFQLKKEIPHLNNDQILSRIYQFITKIGDAHTMVLSYGREQHRFQPKKLPFEVTMFSNGCFVTEATEKYKELCGSKILGVNNHNFDVVYDKVSSLIPKDNEKWSNTLFNKYFRNVNLLHGLQLCDSPDSLEIIYFIDNKSIKKSIFTSLEDSLSKMTDFHTQNGTSSPLFLQNKDEIYLQTYYPDEKILYFQMNQIRNIEEKPLDVFCDSLKTFMNNEAVSAFIIDLRNNTGGNSEYNKIILRLLMSEEINVRGKLFALISNVTFSAAQNLTSDIEKYTEAIFLGEHTGSKPNFIGEVNFFLLPYSRLYVSSSNLYHQHGNYSADSRKWIAPDIFIGFSFEHYKNGEDPVMDEVKDFILKRK